MLCIHSDCTAFEKECILRRKRKDSLSGSLTKANRVTNDERTKSRVWGRHSPTSIWPKAQKTRKRIFVTQVDTCSLYFRALHSPSFKPRFSLTCTNICGCYSFLRRNDCLLTMFLALTPSAIPLDSLNQDCRITPYQL